MGLSQLWCQSPVQGLDSQLCCLLCHSSAGAVPLSHIAIRSEIVLQSCLNLRYLLSLVKSLAWKPVTEYLWYQAGISIVISRVGFSMIIPSLSATVSNFFISPDLGSLFLLTFHACRKVWFQNFRTEISLSMSFRQTH
jgi:hypothetical protein